MSSFKDVLNRREERENLRSFLLSFVLVFVLVLSFFAAHLMKALLEGKPRVQKIEVPADHGLPRSELDG